MAHGKNDYGAPARDRTGRTRRIGTIVGAAVALSLVGAGVIYMEMRRHSAALAQSASLTAEFTVDGPPCPTLTQAQFDAQPLRTRNSLRFNDVTFSRRFGHVECAMTKFRDVRGSGGVPVCQFTSPALLVVTTAKGTFHFQPGMGRRATVSVSDGVPRCVIGGNFGAAG